MPLRHFLDLVWGLLKLVVIGGFVFLGSCQTTRTILKQAPTDVPENWTPRAYTLLPKTQAETLLQSELYGEMTPDLRILEQEKSILDASALEGRATLVQWRLAVGNDRHGQPLDIALMLPNDRPDAPLILSQNFCPNDDVFPFDGVAAPETSSFDCSGGGPASLIMRNVFGRYIVQPPVGDIIDRGYALAVMFPSQFVPDSAERGQEALTRLFGDSDDRPGALAAWANLFPIVSQLIETDYGLRPVVAYGHSRFGKTSLLAGAWFESIDAVVSHQSGTLGASAMDDANGEPLDSLLESYPHWPSPAAQRYKGDVNRLPVRPADLLARLAAKPVLLGNARRDVWSDPWGAFTEAKSAWGADFPAESPGDFRPGDAKAYWLRPGTHGVVKEDWPAFLDFLDANLTGTDG